MKVFTLLLTIALVSAQEGRSGDEIRALIAKLSANRIEVRDAAEKRLLALGQQALLPLRKAVKGSDRDVALRAKRLVRILELAAGLTPALRKAWPGVAEKLAFGNDEAWASVFLKMARRKPPLAGEDLDPLVVRAFRGARTRDERTTLYYAAANRGCKPAIGELVPLLGDPDAVVRTAAVESLYRVGGKEQVPQFIACLKDANSGVRFLAILALSRFRAREALGEIRRILEEDRDSFVRKAAVDALVSLAGRESIPTLVGLMGDPDNRVTDAAIKGLARLKAVEAVPEICRHLEGPPKRYKRILTFDFRLKVMDLLREIEDPRAARKIWPLLRVDKPQVQSKAARVLGLLGNREAIPHLERILTDSDGPPIAAAESLARLGSRKGVPLLLEEGAKSDEVKLHLLNALRRPQTWNKLCAGKIAKRVNMERLEILRKMAGEIGFTCELPDPLPEDLKRGLVYQLSGETRFVDLIDYILSEVGSGLVVERDRIRMLTKERAVAFWKAWWAGEQKKLPKK